MSNPLLPTPLPDAVGGVAVDDPQAVVEGFLAAMMAGDSAAASALVADDILYVNVGLPALRGKRKVDKVLALLDRPGTAFEVYLHATSAEGATVLTERTDVLVLGPFRAQFWVWGRFDVRDGRIVLWRDSFDLLDITKANIRGLLGIVIPALRPKPPTSLDAPPGR